VLLLLALAQPAFAVPVTVTHVDQPNCDPLGVPPEVDELGIGAANSIPGPFPPDEEIAASDQPASLDACPPLTSGNVLVTMTNLTTRDFLEVWYVSDPETSLQNFDGLVNGEEAFLIDSLGANVPLVFESIAFNDIFEAGETWEFIIDDYFNTLGLPASAFRSAGAVGAASPGGPSSGSIIGIVPEPSTTLLLGVGLAGLAFLRRTQAKA
jgi:hypothetical protein